MSQIFLHLQFRFRRQTYVTPKTYLSFLDSYKSLYKEKRQGIDILDQRMRTGLTKLVEAAASVDILRQELAVKDKEIAVANEAAEKVLSSWLFRANFGSRFSADNCHEQNVPFRRLFLSEFL